MDDDLTSYDATSYRPYGAALGVEATDQVAILRERRRLENDERRKFEAGVAYYGKQIELAKLIESNRQERSKDRKRAAQAERMLAMAEAQRDQEATKRQDAERRAVELLDHVVGQDRRFVAALTGEYSSTQLQELAEQVVRDSPELRCPACRDDVPLHVFNGSQFCRSCGWKQGDPTPDHSFDPDLLARPTHS